MKLQNAFVAMILALFLAVMWKLYSETSSSNVKVTSPATAAVQVGKLTASNFESSVSNNLTPAVIELCEPDGCSRDLPRLTKLANEHAGKVRIFQASSSDNHELADMLKSQSSEIGQPWTLPLYMHFIGVDLYVDHGVSEENGLESLLKALSETEEEGNPEQGS